MTAKCALMTNTKIGQAMNQCPLPKSYTLQLFNDKKYNYVNAWNLGLMAKMAYGRVHVGEDVPGGDMMQLDGRLVNKAGVCKWPGKSMYKDYLAQALLKELPQGQGLRDVILFDDTYEDKRGNKYPEYTKHNTNTQAFFAHDDESVVIAIRGTQEVLPDVWIDVDGSQVDFRIGSFNGKGQVHRGFLAQARAIIQSDKFDKYMRQHISGKKVYITGHSLGAAVSTLVAAWLKEQKGIDPILYTYGSPRVGDETFVRGYAGITHYRHVNRHDGVPMIPTSSMDAGHKEIIIGGILAVAVDGVIAAQYLYKNVKNEGPGYYHHGNLMHITNLGEVTVMAPFNSHGITMQGVESASQNIDHKFLQLRSNYEPKLQQLSSEIEKIKSQYQGSFIHKLNVLKERLTPGLISAFVMASLDDLGMSEKHKLRLLNLRRSYGSIHSEYQKKIEQYEIERRKTLPEDDQNKNHTIKLRSATDHGMNNYLEFLRLEIKRIYKLYETVGCKPVTEANSYILPLRRYNKALRTLTSKRQNLEQYLKLYKQMLNEHIKNRETNYAAVVFDLSLKLTQELERITEDIDTLNELYTNFENGSKGLYNLPVDNIDINAQIETM